jgi:hypothetical protein
VLADPGSEVHDLGRSRDACWRRRELHARRFLEPVLHEQVEEIPLVEDLAPYLGVVLPELTHLAVLLGDQLLVHGGDLDVEVLVGKVEVGTEEASRLPGRVELDGEGMRFVLPLDPVEVEESSELPLAVVSEVGEVGLGEV